MGDIRLEKLSASELAELKKLGWIDFLDYVIAIRYDIGQLPNGDYLIYSEECGDIYNQLTSRQGLDETIESYRESQRQDGRNIEIVWL
jgi:hypothetical protein